MTRPIFLFPFFIALCSQTVHGMANTSDVLADGTTPATAAFGPVTGNDVGAVGTLLTSLNDVGIFDAEVGDLNWKLVGASDESGSGPFTSNPSSTSGTLTFDTPIDGPFVISLKVGNSYSAYLFDGSFDDVASVDFETIGVGLNQNGKPQDLSHATLAIPTAVPEPTAMAVWIGLGLALVVFKWRPVS